MIFSLIISIVNAEPNDIIEFDEVEVQGEMFKPRLNLLQEVVHVDPCKDINDVSKYKDCSLNASYENIQSICSMAKTHPGEVKTYLQDLIFLAQRETVYERTEDGLWQYQMDENSNFIVVGSPNRKYDGMIIEYKDNQSHYEQSVPWLSVFSLYQDQARTKITNVDSERYGNHHVTLWNACFSNGENDFYETWYTQVARDDNSRLFPMFVELPSVVGKCGTKDTTKGFGPGGDAKYCEVPVSDKTISSTIYTTSNKYNLESHSFEINTVLGGMWLSPAESWSGTSQRFSPPMTGNAGEYPISSTMIIIINSKTNEFGILYRDVSHGSGHHTVAGKMVFDKSYAEKLLLETDNEENSRKSRIKRLQPLHLLKK